MAKGTINAGICGFTTTIEAEKTEDYNVKLTIESDCPHIQKMANELIEVDALKEISYRRGDRQILTAGAKFCTHAACVVPAGVVKVVEIAAGLALPQQVTINLEK